MNFVDFVLGIGGNFKRLMWIKECGEMFDG